MSNHVRDQVLGMQRNERTVNIQAISVGGGWGFTGFKIGAVPSADGKMTAVLLAEGVKQSSLMPATQIRQVAICPLAQVTIDDLRQAFKNDAGEPDEVPAVEQ